MVKLTVQWNKEKYEVDYTPEVGFDGFQAQLFSLTNVPVDRQKIMVKGKFAKDAAALAALKDGDKVMLMGTADAPPQAPAKQIVFEEDLTDAQKIGVIKDVMSAGLKNLGNTCYMASTLQCLRAVPELKKALISSSGGPNTSFREPKDVIRTLGQLYLEMDHTTKAVVPFAFTTAFKNTFPQFAETNNEGHPMQQDAEEALTQLMNAMAQILKKSESNSSSSSTSTSTSTTGSSSSATNVIDEYFGAQLETRRVLAGLPADDPSAKVERETYRRLQCFITQETNFLFQGIKSSLSENLELRGQNLVRTSTLLTLPRYLIVQMMRFDWVAGKKSKKLRKVDFPTKLDLTDFTHPTLKHQLVSAKNFLKEEQDEKLGLTSLKKAKTEANQTAGSAPASASSTSTTGANPWATDSSAAMEVDSTGTPALTLTTPTSGSYELFGVVTHQGRTSDSGHYISWTKQSDDTWMKFDDDVVSKVTEDQIKGLSGGGDWHMAYLLFYRRIDDTVKFLGKEIPPPTEAKEEKKKETTPAAASSTSATKPAETK